MKLTVAQRLIQFKEAYITAAGAIDKLKEPLMQLIQIREFLDATATENLMTDVDWTKFVNDDLCLILQSASQRKSLTKRM